MYLEIIVGTAECSLDGGARCCVEVASHSGRRSVVADFIQRLSLGGRQVTSAWERNVKRNSQKMSFNCIEVLQHRARRLTAYFTKPSMNSRASFRRTSNGLSFLALRDSFISSSV